MNKNNTINVNTIDFIIITTITSVSDELVDDNQVILEPRGNLLVRIYGPLIGW